jgi:hyperosmotically inducible periplasmic protein
VRRILVGSLTAMAVWSAAATQWPPMLSQYSPLSVARESTLGQSSLELLIRRTLRRLPYFGVFDRLAYRVDGNVVTLFGEVMRPELREDAEAALREIDGVRVNNQIRFLTVTPAENQIRKAVFVAIYTDRWLRPYSLVPGGVIHIVVEGDHVLLDGEVSAEIDRQWAASLAKAAPGVATVENQITVSR